MAPDKHIPSQYPSPFQCNTTRKSFRSISHCNVAQFPNSIEHSSGSSLDTLNESSKASPSCRLCVERLARYGSERNLCIRGLSRIAAERCIVSVDRHCYLIRMGHGALVRLSYKYAVGHLFKGGLRRMKNCLACRVAHSGT